MRSGNQPRGSEGTLAIIGAFKLLKGLLLLGVAGALHLLHRDIADTLAPLIAHVHVDPENRYLDQALTALWALDDRALKQISAGTFFYAALLLIEGVGLLLRQRWAEYIHRARITGSFVPLELYELTRRFTATRLPLIGVNVVVVWTSSIMCANNIASLHDPLLGWLRPQACWSVVNLAVTVRARPA